MLIVQNGSSILVPFTSQLVTPNIQFMKNIPSLISLDNASDICSTQSYRVPCSSTSVCSIVSKTGSTFTLKTQMATSVTSSNIENVLNDAPVTSNFQNVICAATTSSNTMYKIQSKQSSAMHFHTSLTYVLSSNITKMKPARDLSLSKLSIVSHCKSEHCRNNKSRDYKNT